MHLTKQIEMTENKSSEQTWNNDRKITILSALLFANAFEILLNIS